mgnify:CR=1 FL=1
MATRPPRLHEQVVLVRPGDRTNPAHPGAGGAGAGGGWAVAAVGGGGGGGAARPFAVASAIAKICSGTTASSGESSVGDSGIQKISSA